MLNYLKDYKFEAGIGVIAILCLTGLLSLCSGPKAKTFLDLSKNFCDDLGSNLLFANQEKKMVVCQ